MKLKTLLILVLITLPGIFNSFKAQFVYSNKYNNLLWLLIMKKSSTDNTATWRAG